MNAKQAAFLAAYAGCGIVGPAARAARVARRSHYDWMADPEYQAAFKSAKEEAVEALEMEARTRAMVGVAEPVIYQGQLCFDYARDAKTGAVLLNDDGKPIVSEQPLVIWRRSDNLCMFLLKAARPERYRDNATVEHTGPGGGPLAVQVTFVTPKPTG